MVEECRQEGEKGEGFGVDVCRWALEGFGVDSSTWGIADGRERKERAGQERESEDERERESEDGLKRGLGIYMQVHFSDFFTPRYMFVIGWWENVFHTLPKLYSYNIYALEYYEYIVYKYGNILSDEKNCEKDNIPPFAFNKP